MIQYIENNDPPNKFAKFVIGKLEAFIGWYQVGTGAVIIWFVIPLTVIIFLIVWSEGSDKYMAALLRGNETEKVTEILKEGNIFLIGERISAADILGEIGNVNEVSLLKQIASDEALNGELRDASLHALAAVLLREGEKYQSEGKYMETITLYSNLDEIKIREPSKTLKDVVAKVFLQKGNVYSTLSKPEEASTAFKKALHINPDIENNDSNEAIRRLFLAEKSNLLSPKYIPKLHSSDIDERKNAAKILLGFEWKPTTTIDKAYFLVGLDKYEEASSLGNVAIDALKLDLEQAPSVKQLQAAKALVKVKRDNTLSSYQIDTINVARALVKSTDIRKNSGSRVSTNQRPEGENLLIIKKSGHFDLQYAGSDSTRRSYVIYIESDYEKIGTYTPGGGSALINHYYVYLIDIDRNIITAKKRFTGGNPPNKALDAGSHAGPPPSLYAIYNWASSLPRVNTK